MGEQKKITEKMMSFSAILFGWRKRLNRKPFLWLHWNCLVVFYLLAVFLPMIKTDNYAVLFWTATFVLFLYIHSALVVKRGHDLNISAWISTYVPMLVFNVYVMTGLYLNRMGIYTNSFIFAEAVPLERIIADGGMAQPVHWFVYLDMLMGVFLLVYLAALNFVKGTRGPNQYGEDPLRLMQAEGERRKEYFQKNVVPEKWYSGGDIFTFKGLFCCGGRRSRKKFIFIQVIILASLAVMFGTAFFPGVKRRLIIYLIFHRRVIYAMLGVILVFVHLAFTNTVKRYHDLNLSAWVVYGMPALTALIYGGIAGYVVIVLRQPILLEKFKWINLVSVIQMILCCFYLLSVRGNAGFNKFGPDPLGRVEIPEIDVISENTEEELTKAEESTETDDEISLFDTEPAAAEAGSFVREMKHEQV